MEWDEKTRAMVKEASEVTRFRCLNEEGELDPELWHELATELLEEEYAEYEEDLREEGRKYYVWSVQKDMITDSRRRVHQYIEGVGAAGDPPMPTLASLKGEMVSVPQITGRSVRKLVLMCTMNELAAVVAMFGKIAAQNRARQERYGALLWHMRKAEFIASDRVKDLYEKAS